MTQAQKSKALKNIHIEMELLKDKNRSGIIIGEEFMKCWDALRAKEANICYVNCLIWL